MAGNIGDIFFGFRGDGTKLQADAKAEGAKAGNTLGSSMLANVKKSYSGSNIGQGLVQGLGIAGAFGAVSLVSGAIGKMVDIIGDSIAAFNADQASVAKLTASLKANVPGWDGQTDAIERVLLAREKLGFSDDEQRDSLAVLAAKTHDVAKALDIERAAMDLARLKGISLAEATKAISLGLSGSGRGLKELGINVKDYATQTEILAAVQKAAAGQAEAFANTNEGKLLVSQVKVDEAMERLGSVLAGPVADGTAALADALTTIVEGLDATGDAAKRNEEPLQNIANLIHDAFKKPTDDPRTFLGALGTGLDQVNNNVGDAAAAINDFWTVWDDHSNLAERRAKRMGSTFTDLKDTTAADMEKMRGSVGDVAIAVDDTASDMEKRRGAIGNALASYAKAAKDTATKFESAFDRIRQASARVRDALIDDAQTDINNAFDPLILHEKLLASNAEVTAARRAAAAKGASTAERQALLEAEKAQAEFLLAAAKAGQQNSKAYRDGVASLKSEIASATGPTKGYLQGVLDKLYAIDRLDPHVSIFVKTVTTRSGTHPGGGGPQEFDLGAPRKAGGGPVSSGMPYLVGERGPEMFVPGASGTIVPHDQTARMGGTTNVNLTVNAGADTSLSSARRWGQVILDEVAAGLREQTARSSGSTI